jgi:hypothetical protein
MFLLLAATVWAAEVVPAVPTATVVPVVTDPPLNPESTSAKPRRVLSPDTAAKLSAATPKYVAPVVVVPGTADATDTSPVLREIDKPRNQIIRLPRFIVEEQKLHIPKEELQVLTPKGRIEYAFKQRPGLRLVPFAFLNAGIAVQMLEEDLALQRRVKEADLWSLYLIREPAPAQKAR